MKSFRTIKAAAALSAFTLCCVLGTPAALSQTARATNPRQTSQIQASDKKRARRVASASPAEEPAENNPTSSIEAMETTSVAESKIAPNSETMAPPDKVDAAPNVQERDRLRLKVVDQLLSAGLKQEAIGELQAMSREKGFDPQGFYNIANALARLGDTEGAVANYRKSIEQRKGRYSHALNNLGVVLLRQGRWDESYEALTSALRLESFRYAEASYNLGRLYAARGERDLAVREWRRALRVDPEHAAAARALAGLDAASNIMIGAKTPPTRSVTVYFSTGTHPAENG